MTQDLYKVLLTTAYFEPGHRAGGPIKSVARIIDTAGSNVEIDAITRDRDLGMKEPYLNLSGRWIQRGNSRVYYLNTNKLGQWRRLTRQARRRRFDLLYCNSLWEPYFSVLPIVAARLRLISVDRILIAPRGELSPGALLLKKGKKKLFLSLWRRLLASKRVIWHASTTMEEADIKAIWPTASVEVVEDQTDLPSNPITPTQRPGSHLSAVFISRISPKKNLLATIEALAYCTSAVSLSIYGPIEDESYWTRCQSAINQLPNNIQVTYHGPLDASRVVTTFAQYDLFIFPTLGENFGHVIAESLSAACPVLCSNNTPWSSILSTGGGTVLPDTSSKSIGTAVQKAAEMTEGERHQARVHACAAYRAWRNQTNDENILGRISNTLSPKS